MLAAAAVVSVALPASEAWALALGRVNVQSALGEPLRAEVEIPQITAAEAEGLRVGVASPGVFRTQGMEYNATASQVRVSVQRRADGSAVLRLTSTQPVNEPFVDLVIDASWASGNLQRNYTLLLDPPTLQKLPPAVTAAAQASAPEPGAAPRRAAPAPSPAAAGNTEESRPAPAPAAPRRSTASARERAAAAPAPSEASEVRIKTGDTAGRIAAAHLPAGVSLDQMLVAMLRSNPKAFINGNVNRMRSGAVLTVPDEATAQATSPRERARSLQPSPGISTSSAASWPAPHRPRPWHRPIVKHRAASRPRSKTASPPPPHPTSSPCPKVLSRAWRQTSAWPSKSSPTTRHRARPNCSATCPS
ncbi:hypothetical protein GY14_04600 [Delftia tsuruhatensis]|nr:hypothetical protein GY14_04600 [Delftia tsuruhatensis]